MNDLTTQFSEKPAMRLATRIFDKSGWLSKRPKAVRELLLPCGRQRHYQAGDTLYRVGDAPEGIYGLMKGRVCLSVPNDAGNVYDCFLGNPGFWIGDLALFSVAPRLVTVSAETDLTVWFLPQPRLLEMLQSHPDLIADFYALNHVNMAIALRIMANLAIPDGGRRLAAWLLFSDDGNAVPGDWIEVSQEQVAMMNAMSLPAARRLLKKLSDSRLIELGYTRVRIRNRAGLAKYCAG